MCQFNPDLLQTVVTHEQVLAHNLIDSPTGYYIFTHAYVTQVLSYKERPLLTIHWLSGAPDNIGLPTNTFYIHQVEDKRLALDGLFASDLKALIAILSVKLGMNLTKQDIVAIRNHISNHTPCNWTTNPDLYSYDINLLGFKDEQEQVMTHLHKVDFTTYLLCVSDYGASQVSIKNITAL